jgi:polysaccharide deacetylase family protein (PEP-CTERM system associated)
VLTTPERGPEGFWLRTEPAALVSPKDPAAPRHAFTVDVEDWYQSCIDYDAPITERVVRNVDRMLEVLDECGVKGTFFVQGKVAETFPRLVSTLVATGHEVQSHGYSHRPLSGMNVDELRAELERAKKTVEDAAGLEVNAFRAQDFSIVAENLWAIDVILDVGFQVDSSIFPMRSRHYGIRNWVVGPHYLVLRGGRRILEIPVAIWTAGRVRIPVAGGGYFRLLPQAVVERGLRAVEESGRPAIVYCHPYEFAINELADYQDVPRHFRVMQELGRRNFPDRLGALFSKLSFGRMDHVLSAWGLRPRPRA